jgi:hypothetical protein
MKSSELDIDFSLIVTKYLNVADDICRTMESRGWLMINVKFDGVADEYDMHELLKERLRLHEWYHTSYDALSDSMNAINEIFASPKVGIVLRFIGDGLCQWKDKLALSLLDVLRDRRNVFGEDINGVSCDDRLMIVWVSSERMFPVFGGHPVYSIKAYSVGLCAPDGQE